MCSSSWTVSSPATDKFALAAEAIALVKNEADSRLKKMNNRVINSSHTMGPNTIQTQPSVPRRALWLFASATFSMPAAT
jgi:hypothetical protein